MSFKLAFDKNLRLEFLVFDPIYYDKSKKLFFSSYKTERMINPLGTFLLMFLNTNFENDKDCGTFIFKFCFKALYYSNYNITNKDNHTSLTQVNFTFSDFYDELDKIVKEYKDDFLYLKYTLLNNLRLPYDLNFFRKIEEDAEFTPEDIQIMREADRNFFEDKSIKYKENEINDFLEDLNIQFETLGLLFNNVDIYKYNIPYYFKSDNIFSIIALMFKEFMSDNRNTIRQCKNCEHYFIPSNLKETKYCNVEYENTGKTCKQIGKALAYKKSLMEDTLLDKYRKRYMSLASSVSHYGTDSAIARFERYKKDGAVMKQKYLNKEISPKDFEKWILDSKK